MPVIALLLFLLSGAVAAVGLLSLSNATLGVGLIALACYIAIVSRLAQATGHLEAMWRLQGGKEQKAVKAHAVTQGNDIACGACGHIAPRGPSACPSCGVAYAR